MGISSSDGHSSPLALEVRPLPESSRVVYQYRSGQSAYKVILLEGLVGLQPPSSRVHAAPGVGEGHGAGSNPACLVALADGLVGAGAHLGGDPLLTHLPLWPLIVVLLVEDGHVLLLVTVVLLQPDLVTLVHHPETHVDHGLSTQTVSRDSHRLHQWPHTGLNIFVHRQQLLF